MFVDDCGNGRFLYLKPFVSLSLSVICHALSRLSRVITEIGVFANDCDGASAGKVVILETK